MIFHPGILALLLGSVLTAFMLGYSAYEGIRIIRSWDIRSGSDRQLELERRTYLVSTIMSYAMGFQLLSLFLFVYTVDALSPLFIGAMCAAGSLKVNGFGYPTLILKIVSCLLSGLWFIVNYTDNQAHDYPLIQTKCWLLLFIAPLLIAETVVQAVYLLSLKPNIITSCCGIMFSTDAKTVMSDLLALPQSMAQVIYFSSAAITIASGLRVLLRAKGAIFFSIASLIHFLVSVTALVSFISIYYYELPTHHCPFCILHQEYGYVGYLLYLLILTGTVSGIGTGVIDMFQAILSLRDVVPRIQNRLALISIISTALFVLITCYEIIFSNLSMFAK